VQSLAQVPQWKDFQWSLFISTVVWCNGGFDSLGQFAGEVDGASTFVLGMMMMMMMYVRAWYAWRLGIVDGSGRFLLF
jgi:hypothetical protein